MRQVLFRSGRPLCVDVPPPQAQARQLLVHVRASCISPGTELTGLTASGKSLWQKALDNPAKVKTALERMKTEGMTAVWNKARAQEGGEHVSGYSAAGVVDAVGPDTTGYVTGMRVAVAGAAYAHHADQVAVPVNLAMTIPDGVSFEDAATCALGGIALQGIRRADVSLGDVVTVMGCGAIGLLTVQMLRAAGCRVIGMDPDAKRLALAEALGAEWILDPTQSNAVEQVVRLTNGQGADRVILTVATDSPEPLNQAFAMSRRKGRVVLVGVAGMHIEREQMYRKELDFVISTSYGPGRYDPRYEEQGIDYPYAYVRWTEQRNMQAYLHMLADGSVKLDRMVGGTFPVEQADAAYAALTAEVRPLLVLFTYGGQHDDHARGEARRAPPAVSGERKPWIFPKNGVLNIGVIGAGAFVQNMHFPILKAMADRFRVTAVCNATGPSARKAAALYGDACRQGTDPDALLAAADVDVVLIGTRHHLHAEWAMKALQAGKGVFLEKPMCLTADECERLEQVLQDSDGPFMVGYNRRFAPLIETIHKGIARRANPLMIHYTMNAGFLPPDHWVHTHEGGGRIIGEGCHIFDLFRHLVGAPVRTVSVDALRPKTADVSATDNVTITGTYQDGSVCTLLYTSLGHPKPGKEHLSVFCDGNAWILNDYRSLSGYGAALSGKSKQTDKGHAGEWTAFHRAVAEGSRFPIPWEHLKETFQVSLHAAEAIVDPVHRA